MTKPISIKMPDDMYDEMMSYAIANNQSLSGLCRSMVKQGFLNALTHDQARLKRYKLMLEDASRYQMTTREIADLETQVAILTTMTERFGGLLGDLAIELYGEDSDNA